MLTIAASTFRGSHASAGGAIDGYGIVHVSNSTFYANRATGATAGGGAPRLAQTAFITNSTIYSNSAPANGGGIHTSSTIGTCSVVNTIVAASPTAIGETPEPGTNAWQFYLPTITHNATVQDAGAQQVPPVLPEGGQAIHLPCIVR
jgi:hypothetical protein